MTDRVLSHYQILEQLGAGGMGVVYKAKDTRLDRLVALKVLPMDKVQDPERCQRFIQEAKAASALNHPNIVTIYDIGQAGGEQFIAMELVSGRTLGQLIGRKGLPLKEVLNYATQMADALGKAHAAGIVHRDLKPSNIMVTEDGLVKILDFGLAKLIGPSPISSDDAPTMTQGAVPITEAGKILGTVAYMSPEQAEGKPVDARSDIFAFGSVLYEMITGRNPFAGETSVSTLASIITKEPQPPSQLSVSLPPEVEHLVMRCLRKEPQRRIQTMSDLKVMLQDLKEDSDSGKLSAASGIRAAAAPARRRLGLWLTGVFSAFLLIAAGVGVALYFLQPGKQVETAAPQAEKLTFESGLMMEPTISADGKLIAYASDAAGSLDIYVRQIGSSQAIRRSQHEADDRDPCFSPDGSKIVFRSERDGGGLYIMDTLVGSERKIAEQGSFPNFSPDGITIAYLVGSPLIGRAKMFLVPVNGGLPQPFRPEFVVASGGITYSRPLWSPDGTCIIFDGMRPGDLKSRSWWLAPLSGDPIRLAPPPRRPNSSFRVLFAWRRNYVYYVEGNTNSGGGIYRIAVSDKPWKLTGTPEHIFELAGMMLGGSVSDEGRVVFSLVEPTVNIWSVDLQGNKGVASGRLQPVTNDSVQKLAFAVTPDGLKMAYSAYAPPAMSIRIRDLASGREDQVITSGMAQDPLLSQDGATLGYTRTSGGYAGVVTTLGSPATKDVCNECMIRGFFSNPAEVMLDKGDKVVRHNVRTGQEATLMDTPGMETINFALSPDDRRIAFVLPVADTESILYLSPVSQQPTRKEMWSQIASDRNYLGAPAWSPDGKLLYYVSSRDGFKCVWAQRIADDGKPEGAPFAVHHNHKASPSRLPMGRFGTIQVTRDKLYMLLAEAKGNLWSLRLQ